MSTSVHADPIDDEDSSQVLPPLPVKQPDADPPMEPNPYMGGGTTPA